MSILRRYYLKEFFKFFLIFIFTITAILVIAEFFDKADEFYANKSPVYLTFQYLIYNCPKFLLYASPMASLFSILITIGIASNLRETVAIKAGGGSLRKLFSSFLVLGAIISVFTFIIGETVVPAATRKAAYVRSVKILKRSQVVTFREEALWLKGLDGSLIRIKDFVQDSDKILQTSIFSFDPSFKLQKRIESEEAEWSDGAWKLKNSTVFDLDTQMREKHDSLVSNAMDEPKIFKEEVKKPDEMNFIELRDYYNRLENSGFKNLKYKVQLYEKLAYPTINFVMIVFGVALALNTRWGGGVRAAGLGIVVTILYWLTYSVSISLGNTGAIVPWLAPWIGPVAFGIAGSLMYVNIKE
ncbi:MAG: LptF/LptG family permease [Thermodesulfovibrionia bacterium]|nr:LptF/LptG family permease [Thermodesulfovibrionia bacterium]